MQLVYRADSRLALSQWETSLQSNAVVYWLGANLESALVYIAISQRTGVLIKHVLHPEIYFSAGNGLDSHHRGPVGHCYSLCISVISCIANCGYETTLVGTGREHTEWWRHNHTNDNQYPGWRYQRPQTAVTRNSFWQWFGKWNIWIWIPNWIHENRTQLLVKRIWLEKARSFVEHIQSFHDNHWRNRCAFYEGHAKDNW